MDLFTSLSAFAVFLAIGGLGLAFLLISLIFGEIFDAFDTSLDHELDHGPGLFSTRVMSIFITAFGGFGAIATHYGLSPLAASGVGFLSGAVFGGLAYSFARFLYGQQATSEVRASELVGQPARVIVSIPAGGVGQVRCRVGEELIDKIARAHDGATIPEHATVRVEEVLGEIVVVRKS
jgi:membrane protein implicated in regulation of membrane protease activity